MNNKFDSSKIVSDITLLYELSLAVGSSLDLQKNCENFLKTLMARKNLAYASVWIKSEHLPGYDAPPGATLVYAKPESRIKVRQIPDEHPLLTRLADQAAFSLTSADSEFFEIVIDKEITRGAFAIFALGEIGFLELYSAARNAPFDTRELRQLSQVIDKFTNSIKGCFAHQQATQTRDELHHAEQELVKFKLGIERSSDAVFLTEPDGTIIYINSAFEKIYGYTWAEAIGQTPRLLKSGLIPPEAYEQFWDTLLNKKETIVGEIINQSKDGRLVNIAANNIPILGENGNMLGFLAIHHDITQSKQAEAERDRLLAEVEAAYNQYVRREWDQYLSRQPQGELLIEHRPIDGLPVEKDGAGNPSTMESSISLRGQPVGILSLQDSNPDRNWTDEEKALVETVSEQLAQTAENLRLFDVTRRRAGREQAIREITDKVRAAPNLDALLEVAARELGQQLGVRRAALEIGIEAEDSRNDNGSHG